MSGKSKHFQELKLPLFYFLSDEYSVFSGVYGKNEFNKKAQQQKRYQAFYSLKSDPVWIRTKDLLLRRQLLYPAELRDLISISMSPTEPKTFPMLRSGCSIQLLVRRSNRRRELRDLISIKKGDDFSSPLSGRQDSNLRPPGPKPGAMTGLRYAPYFNEYDVISKSNPNLRPSRLKRRDAMTGLC